MNRKFRIILTARAVSDLQHIAAFVFDQSPQNAAKLANRLSIEIHSLELMPSRFKKIGTSKRSGMPIHSLVVRPFLVYYRVDESDGKVIVLTVRHGARRQPRRFD